MNPLIMIPARMAATRLPGDQPALCRALQALEVRALGCLLEELAASLGESQTPRNSSFAGKAKRFWADILGAEATQ